MTGKNEYLKDYRKLDSVEEVKFGNNNKCSIKEYGKITNGKFTIKCVAYVGCLKCNLISVLQLVVGTCNQVIFDGDVSVILNKILKEVMLKSTKRRNVHS